MNISKSGNYTNLCTGSLNPGRYELPRRSGDAHLYRIGHPLASWVIERCKDRELASAKLVFDYEAYGKKQSTLEPYRGNTQSHLP
ncbi:hypothetical protein YERSI8AC_510013 [Enterobacterales bacterium 8AC]|nr:hypothetical protein YERSI8AC_510013 [Enterobacterales bacterium 8AC]